MKELQHIEDMVVVKRDTPMNPKALREIREILEGVKSGKLLHSQKAYHTITGCGTAHCIAGWKCHLDATKAGLEIADYKADTNYDCESPTLEDFLLSRLVEAPKTKDCEWSYAEREWRLALNEACILFDAESTLDEQFELLEALEAGYTLKRHE
jgi:hypothetical protein